MITFLMLFSLKNIYKSSYKSSIGNKMIAFTSLLQYAKITRLMCSSLLQKKRKKEKKNKETKIEG